MRKYLFPLTILLLAVLTGCKDTWLMYDTGQKSQLYFTSTDNGTKTADFSLIVEDEILVGDSVRVMGMPVDRDRVFEIECLEVPDGSTFTTGTVTRPMVSGVMGRDFRVGELRIPAGKVSAKLDVILTRSEAMRDQAVCVWIRLKENGEFAACAPDSSKNSSGILTPEYRIVVSDGNPACPAWWKWNGAAYPLGWHPYLGNYYPDKYRRMLQYLREAETLSPTFYLTYTGNWGLNLENAPSMFWNKCFTSAWARYVAVPLYNYYYEYYQEHPDDPNKEEMEYANIPGHVGWGNPSEGTYGILN